MKPATKRRDEVLMCMTLAHFLVPREAFSSSGSALGEKRRRDSLLRCLLEGVRQSDQLGLTADRSSEAHIERSGPWSEAGRKGQGARALRTGNEGVRHGDGGMAGSRRNGCARH